MTVTWDPEFDTRNREAIRRMGRDEELRALSLAWMTRSVRDEYSYHFTWMGCPVIQYPSDLMALQEIIWRVRPQLVVETGVARGGSLVFYASLLALLGGDREVVGVDIEIRGPNRAALESHPMSRRITLIEGSSIDAPVVEQVRVKAVGRSPVLVVLDSNHVAAHVLAELEAYAPLVTAGSYLVVCDTIVDELPPECSRGRAWGPGNGPGTAVRQFLAATERFEADTELENKLQITVAPGGYLKCVR